MGSMLPYIAYMDPMGHEKRQTFIVYDPYRFWLVCLEVSWTNLRGFPDHKGAMAIAECHVAYIYILYASKPPKHRKVIYHCLIDCVLVTLLITVLWYLFGGCSHVARMRTAFLALLRLTSWPKTIRVWHQNHNGMTSHAAAKGHQFHILLENHSCHFSWWISNPEASDFLGCSTPAKEYNQIVVIKWLFYLVWGIPVACGLKSPKLKT